MFDVPFKSSRPRSPGLETAVPSGHMPIMVRINASRRYLIAGTIGSFATLAATKTPLAAALPTTPRQSAGPFYPNVLSLDTDNDLVRVQGRAAQAVGEITHVFGRVVDTAGNPIAGARVEIWQCDANGRYIHTSDARRGGRDEDFQGYGETITAADGGYRFRTIKPVPYGSRTPHIHFAVLGNGFDRLVTQMYIAGEPRNDRDFLYRRIGGLERQRLLTVDLRPRPDLEAKALGGQFDIVLG